ncbi:MAG: lipopolysaccharide biosynthesis protein [Chitinophagaceae bacterium]|nr:MAG: lipopolysaccharide biosynthesis protein [Chitinophagaceae bacterium]
MSIRRQSIISSLVIYIGFAVGLLNTYFFTTDSLAGQPLFTTTEYGLTGIFVAIATMMLAFANLAMPTYIWKFYHYYDDFLPPRKNDMITWALVVSTIGFVLVLVVGWILRDLVIRKFGAKSPELLSYYYWIFPMGLGLTIFAVLEAYAWNLGKPVLTNFLKEIQWRVLVTILIVLFAVKIIPTFDLFIKLYAFTHLGIALTLFLYLWYKGKIHLTFKISKVSRRYFRKIAMLCSFVYASTIIFTLSQVFDTIVIAAYGGIDQAGIFTLATLMTSVIHAPQRGVVAAAVPHLSRAWKDKNITQIQRIYQRSSINLLIFASGIFVLIALNYTQAIITLNLKEDYLLGFNAFLVLGITRVIDLGTGVNSEIIATSNFWRFQLISGVVLLVLMIPLTIFLTKTYNILGPAIAGFIAISVYNSMRIIFLWKKYKLFPFTDRSLYAVITAIACWAACHYAFLQVSGWSGMIGRSVMFVVLYGGLNVWFRLSPDIHPVVATILKKTGLRKRSES